MDDSGDTSGMMEGMQQERHSDRQLNGVGSSFRVRRPDSTMTLEEDELVMSRSDDMDERRDTEEREENPRDDMMNPSDITYQQPQHWFIPMPTVWYARQAAADVDDCREDDDMEIEREGSNEEDWRNARIHEPLKRQQQQDTEQANKRRRLMETISMACYNSISTPEERQQVLGEYLNPLAFSFLFPLFGLSPLARQWALVLFVGHFFQVLVSDFGPKTKSMRWKAWIKPLPHCLMDAYLWNHPLVSFMLLYDKDLFGSTKAYWLAIFFAMGQGQGLNGNLKAHYLQHQDKFHQPEDCRQMELHFIDGFFLYGLACLVFILARVLGSNLLLWVGLVVFNIAPLFVVWAYKKRMDAAMKRQPIRSFSADTNNKKKRAGTKKMQ